MNDRKNEEIEIDLVELLSYLARKWKRLLLGFIIGALIAGVFTYMKTPLYRSEAMLYVVSKTNEDSSTTSVGDMQLGNYLTSDFEVIATSRPVLDKAIEEVYASMGVQLEREEVLGMISVSNKSDTRVLVITATSEDPKLACVVTNAVTDATAEQMTDILEYGKPTTVERAEVAAEPIDNGLKKNVAIGAIIGLLIVAIAYIIPYLLNDRVQTPEDVERYLKAEVLGSIPLDRAQAQQDKERKKRTKRNRRK